MKARFNTKKKPPKEVTFKLGELFCGPGGLARGALHSRFEHNNTIYKLQHAWATDYDQDSCDTYSGNICHEKKSKSVVCADIRKLNLNRLKKISNIDGFAYGFPCNDFSIVGEQLGFLGNYGPLYTYGVKILDDFKPKFFVAENVGGIANANVEKSFRKILDDLASAGPGYNITAHLYKSEKYGVPQMRHRIIIVGIKKSLKLTFKVPKPTTPNKPITARQALENPPILHNSPNNELTRQSKTVIERLEHIKPWENAWTANLPPRLRLNVKSAKLSHIYRRLHPDKPSYTITGSGGGGTHGYHWEEPRALTNRERARIQTFPDDFVFEGSKESVRKQIGMAVPVELSKVIFTAILKTFAGIEYPYVLPSLSNGQDE